MSLPEAPTPAPTRTSGPDAFAAFFRPFLRLSLARYRVEVSRDLYPRDEPVFEIAGADPQRLLFVGDVAAFGHGVLSHGLTVATRTAAVLATTSGRGARWSIVAETDLTLDSLLRRPLLGVEGVEAAFLLVGIPDALLLTRPDAWARDLERVARKIQQESGRDVDCCPVFVAGIPPLSNFRPISASMRRLTVKQVDRLNAVSAEVAARTPGLEYVPFPTWRIGDMYIQKMFSWKTMHEAWATSLAAAARSRPRG